METLRPIGPAWVCPSLIFGVVALCRDPKRVWLCRGTDESERWKLGRLADERGGWLRLKLAETDDVEAFRWSQRLAGNPVEPWPEAAIPEPAGRARP